ncbi:hypothetical protein Hypma_011101 [Hypsizygus marmoreus]|uniref:Uncharacterized protein n=1 Tax=Hypsizygus marmoreus TaxID=39966 RepID=A0A369JL83_HYPMA|nr:hypothetical protein Hypma_011101 [Hypsizygus marmoreus]
MSNMIRSAKSGSDWTSNDLAAYNIRVRRQSAEDFFGYKPDTIPDTVDPAFLTARVPPTEDLSDATYRLLQYLDLANNANSGQESAIHDFAKELLRLLGFEERGTLLRSRYAIPFMISGDTGRVAQTDLCLVHGSSTILLVIQEDEPLISSKNPEAQVVAEAITTFQYNNAARDRSGFDELESMTIPAITMIGTRPVFYKIRVTQQLSNAVAMAQYPTTETEVYKCIVAPGSRRLSEGMENPEFRQDILKHYEAFKKLAKECWAEFIIA